MCILWATLCTVSSNSYLSAAEPKNRPSGLSVGEEVSAWEPVHVAGPLAGTKTCPVCTYLEAPVLLAFAKDSSAAELLAKPLERIADAHSKGKLRVVLVVLDAPEEKLRKLAEESKIRHLMLCMPDPKRREKQLAAYKIDPTVPNTIMLYEAYTVRRLWVSVTSKDLASLEEATIPYLPRR
jgi:protocatechuate 3,4-dioxygenase beta subunit